MNPLLDPNGEPTKIGMELNAANTALLMQLAAAGTRQFDHIRKAFHLISDNDIARGRLELQNSMIEYSKDMKRAEEIARQVFAISERGVEAIDVVVAEEGITAGEGVDEVGAFLKRVMGK